MITLDRIKSPEEIQAEIDLLLSIKAKEAEEIELLQLEADAEAEAEAKAEAARVAAEEEAARVASEAKIKFEDLVSSNKKLADKKSTYNSQEEEVKDLEAQKAEWVQKKTDATTAADKLAFAKEATSLTDAIIEKNQAKFETSKEISNIQQSIEEQKQFIESLGYNVDASLEEGSLVKAEEKSFSEEITDTLTDIVENVEDALHDTMDSISSATTSSEVI